jgi:hypothetical protein
MTLKVIDFIIKDPKGKCHIDINFYENQIKNSLLALQNNHSNNISLSQANSNPKVVKNYKSQNTQNTIQTNRESIHNLIKDDQLIDKTKKSGENNQINIKLNINSEVINNNIRISKDNSKNDKSLEGVRIIDKMLTI